MKEAFIQAAENGNTAEVLRLIAAGADVNGRDERGRTPILAATHGNHPDTVKSLLDAGADMNLQDDRQDNPFLYAGAEGLIDIVKLMIEAGADPTLTNRFGGTALIPASERGHVDVVQALLEHSEVDVNHVNNLGWTALMEAIVLSDGGVRHQQIIRLLIQHGADVHIPDRNGMMPLEHARSSQFKEIERLLVEAGA
ncbi:hypothetical protein BVG16_22670 [Paenibacillus selenitireducens]|uniref:Uncharacterized protein n=1 Tax=Paenibacillus selenitireducens TaxID=1324314 RepID=A0A1T2X4F8_9BACL|nr:ankyrin repeat domain-containing protein [Paenibacillus selenitireducens]OPA74791.1 hypothetical protein BVG16_22670 [Paenibacillus selenitireducens]